MSDGDGQYLRPLPEMRMPKEELVAWKFYADSLLSLRCPLDNYRGMTIKQFCKLKCPGHSEICVSVCLGSEPPTYCGVCAAIEVGIDWILNLLGKSQ